MKPKRYPYSGQNKKSTSNEIDLKLIKQSKIIFSDTSVQIEADKIDLNHSREKSGNNRIFYGKEKPTTAVEGDCWFKNGELLIFKND